MRKSLVFTLFFLAACGSRFEEDLLAVKAGGENPPAECSPACTGSDRCVNGVCVAPNPEPPTCNGVVCAAGQKCGLDGQCFTPGSVSPGGQCTTDEECRPGVCLPPRTGETTRVCSFYQFSMVCDVDSPVIKCYNGSGDEQRPNAFNIPANTQFSSNPSRNEASCVAVDVSAGRCKQTCYVNGSTGAYITLPASGTLNPSSATATHNCSYP